MGTERWPPHRTVAGTQRADALESLTEGLAGGERPVSGSVGAAHVQMAPEAGSTWLLFPEARFLAV